MRPKPSVFEAIRLDAADVQVSEQEILADLLYPAPPDAPARPVSGRDGRG
jgi:hypothetical protein